MSLWSEQILVAVPEGQRSPGREPVHWIDLREERILLSWRNPGPELHDLLIAKVTPPGNRPKIVRHRAGLANLRVSSGRASERPCYRGLRRCQLPRCDLSRAARRRESRPHVLFRALASGQPKSCPRKYTWDPWRPPSTTS